MNIFFAMGISTTQDSSGYFLLLPHMWPVFVIPFIGFYLVLSVWVVRKVKQCMEMETTPSAREPSMDGGERGIRTPGGV